MKVILYFTLFILSSHYALATVKTSTHADSTAMVLKEDALPADNMSSILNFSNARLMSNVIVLYNALATKSLGKGSAKAAEETLLKKSIPLSIRYGTDRTNYNCFMALAKCYVDQKKYTQAKWYYIQSNISARKAKYAQGEVLSLMQLAQLKKVIGDDQLALEDYKEAEKLAVKINFKTQLPHIRKSIASFPEALQKPAPEVQAKVEEGS